VTSVRKYQGRFFGNY